MFIFTFLSPREGEEKVKKGETYRDRAAERREGDADEYAEGEEILRVLYDGLRPTLLVFTIG